MLTRSWGDNRPTNVVFACECFSAQPQPIQQIVVIVDPKIMGEINHVWKHKPECHRMLNQKSSAKVDPQLDYKTHSLINIHRKYNPCLLFGALIGWDFRSLQPQLSVGVENPLGSNRGVWLASTIKCSNNTEPYSMEKKIYPLVI